MELALLLVVLVIAELALTVWFLARQSTTRKSERSLTKRVTRLEKNVTKMAEVLRDMSRDADELEITNDATISDLVAAATPEDVAKANEILKALGLDNEG